MLKRMTYITWALVVGVCATTTSAVDLWYEAENATEIRLPMEVFEDRADASRGKYVTNPEGINRMTAAVPGEGGIYEFSAPAGTYVVYARVVADNTSNDSFYCVIHGATVNVGLNPPGYLRFNVPLQGTAWHWVAVSDSPSKVAYWTLPADGVYQMEIQIREGGTLIDGFLISDKLNIDLATLPDRLPVRRPGEDPSVSEPDPPDVNAGDYRSILWQGEPVSVQLDASVHNADLASDGVFTFQWSELCGSGSVEFLPSADIEDPCAVFSAPGIYTLLLQAWDEVAVEGNNIAVIHIRETRPVEGLADDIAAWERLRNLEIPGIDTDSRFRITCASTRYVSPTGSDSNAGTIDSPWRTLSKAASSMASRQVIYLREGVYYGPVEISFHGSKTRPAALRGYPGEHVIVRYSPSFIDENQAAEYYASLIEIKGPYVEVSNLHLIGARDQLPQSSFSAHGIWFRKDAAGGRILCNEIENIGHCGVKGGRHALIEANYIHDVGYNSLNHGIYCPDDDATVRKNLITNSTGFGVHAYSSPTRLEITHNILIGHDQYGVVLAGPACRVLHNLFYHNTRGGILFFRRQCLDNIVKNNIFDEPVRAIDHASRGRPDQAEHPQNNLTDYNCLVPITPLGRPSPYDTYGANNFTADPRWVNPDQLDFRLTRSSPCIDAGEDEGYGSNCGPFYAPAPLSRSAEDFETGDFSRLPWEHSGNENWTVTLRQKHTGAYSAKAGAIEDDGNTTLKVTLDCSDGDVTFYCKVSSESGSDYLKFYIDRVKQGEWSGEQDWAEVSFPVTVGTRTFEWTYSKDGSESDGSDTAWIDDIVFPI